ncbi:GNAT family N-acetyltransferase [Arcobacter sp. CECT 8985]|uniref:GNAT family N-acetyltransferase n=1 Tax=Arcobacter sp. CECT 8985 TaxID=1935424 RepID=UPI00100A7FF4|nr:GNAT family N-acetyltransferase [Arcobacter sp. CECT 8985]RXJ87230.1 GNAT family N-acetyltransferase [Arcobacter sp. CECT 8985]
MKRINSINFSYVYKHLEKPTKDYILKEYMKHYEQRISKSQYEVIYKKMSILMKQKDTNAFFVSYNEKKQIIGAISITKYDNRILSLKNRYMNKDIAEIGRCYVDEKYRRCGVGSRLLNLAIAFAEKNNYEKMYLHTHYFLPGGYNFWSKKGFKITLDEKNKMPTVHMERELENNTNKYNIQMV